MFGFEASWSNLIFAAAEHISKELKKKGEGPRKIKNFASLPNLRVYVARKFLHFNKADDKLVKMREESSRENVKRLQASKVKSLMICKFLEKRKKPEWRVVIP